MVTFQKFLDSLSTEIFYFLSTFLIRFGAAVAPREQALVKVFVTNVAMDKVGGFIKKKKSDKN